MAQAWYPNISQERCVGCGDCITQCPSGALGWQESNVVLAHPQRCQYCGTCEDICPSSAIELPMIVVNRYYREDI